MNELIKVGLSNHQTPEIVGELCVHSMFEAAGCRACVDACPRQAWVLDQDALGLNENACDGCGLCVPSCPEGAIQPLHEPGRYHWQQRETAWVACEKTGLQGEGVMPCIHCLGLRDLLLLYRRGCRDILSSRSDCAGCERGEADRLQDAVVKMNLLLQDLRLPGMEYRELSPKQWRNNLRSLVTPPKGPEMGRRLFLRRAVGMVVDERSLEEKLGLDRSAWSLPLGRLLPPFEGEARQPFVPSIDAQRCNGCDACINLCPHQALTLQRDKTDAPVYRISAEDCSGCGICTDVCETAAISVSRWTVPEETVVELALDRCPACGVEYHEPRTGKRQTKSLCRICRVVNHYRNLHQVLD